MTADIFMPSAIYDTDLEILMEVVSFPLTKAEIIYKAEAKGVRPSIIGLLRKLPSRFYHSKDELINQCLVRNMHYSEIGFNIRLDYQTKT
jgi:hypothetical protein